MKKNTKKLAVVLLVAFVAIGSYFVSGTYAKYTSEISGNGTGTVAKWAWTIGDKEITSGSAVSGFTFDLFKDILDTNGGAAETDVHQTDSKADRIAPGTKGQINLKITNNSEVNAKYTLALSATNSNNVPIEYSIDGGSTWVTDISTLSVTAETPINMGTSTEEKVLQWRWAFTGADSSNFGTGANLEQTDAYDTNLGFAANNEPAPTVVVSAVVTVTQAD